MEPYDEKYWGPGSIDISRWHKVECMRGCSYHSTGAPSQSGAKNQVRKISTGRKERGSAFDDYERRNPGAA